MQYDHVWSTLAQRGHTVEIYSAFPPKQNLTNLKHVELKTPKFVEMLKGFNAGDLPGSTSFIKEIMGTYIVWLMGMGALEESYQTQTFQTLMASDKKFDLVLTETFFAMESSVALGHRFNAATIALCTFGPALDAMHFFGNPNLPSFMPDFRFAHPDRMSFVERLKNFYLVVFTKSMEYFYYHPKQQALVDKYFGSNYPSLQDMMTNMSATLLYTNHAMAWPAPMVPNMIPVGGIHLKKPGKLPQDLQKLADDAKNGFIYMSFGSNIDSSKLYDYQKQRFIDIFKKINLPIFWKMEIDLSKDTIINTKTLPKNVIVRKWYPQTDILAHPNIRLFVSHGGISSIMEATSIGVPILGVPFFGDQPYNLKLVETRGCGLSESFSDLSADSFAQKMHTILKDPKFKENSLKWSRISNDNLATPLDTAVYWVEYVLRHKGAHHLSAASRYMSWYQLYCLDLIAFMLATLYIVYKMLALVVGRCRKSAKKQVPSTKKNK